jgi:hypothetical protein
MNRFDVGKVYGQSVAFGAFSEFFSRNHALVSDVLDQSAKEKILTELETLIKILLDAGFSAVAKQAERLHGSLHLPDLTADIFGDRLLALVARVKETCEEQAFFFVPTGRRAFYETKCLFGMEVEAAFPLTVTDIEEAGKCFALARWTACVFHLMRVLEIGLHKTAETVGVQWSGSGTLTQQQWQVIIDQIECRIREMEKSIAKGNKKSDLMQAYSQAATAFRYFKEAWRNHVSHSKTSYNEEQAERIFQHVKAFMRDAASLPVLP